ncbi:unnamed protein product [Ectocarpus sp. 8 AP-2014]
MRTSRYHMQRTNTCTLRSRSLSSSSHFLQQSARMVVCIARTNVAPWRVAGHEKCSPEPRTPLHNEPLSSRGKTNKKGLSSGGTCTPRGARTTDTLMAREKGNPSRLFSAGRHLVRCRAILPTSESDSGDDPKTMAFLGQRQPQKKHRNQQPNERQTTPCCCRPPPYLGRSPPVS